MVERWEEAEEDSFEPDDELIAVDGFGAGGVVYGGAEVDSEARGGVYGGGLGIEGKEGHATVVGGEPESADDRARCASGADGNLGADVPVGRANRLGLSNDIGRAESKLDG